MSGSGPGRRAVLLGGVGALTGPVLGGCSAGTSAPTRTLVVDESGAAPTRGDGSPTAAALAEIMERRAAALRAGDERAFLADLDAGNADLIAGQRRLFRNLRQFDVARLAFVADHSLAVPGAETWDVAVSQLVRLGVDVGPDGVAGAEAFVYRFVRRADRWVVQDVRPGRNARPAPWSLTDLTVTRSGTLYLAGDRTAEDVSRFASVADTEVARVERLWGSRPRFPGYALFFSRDVATLGAWYSEPGHPGELATWAEGWVPRLDQADAQGAPYPGEAASARVVVNLEVLDSAGDPREPGAMLRHELVHAVSARTTVTPAAGSDVSRWVVEGFARYVEYAVDASRAPAQFQVVRGGVARGWFTGSPPESRAFYDTARRGFNYSLASTVFHYVATGRGVAAATDFYDRTHRIPDPGPGRYLRSRAFDAACRGVTGLSATAFLAAWGAHVRDL